MTSKDAFVDLWEREFPTTLKVLRAYPADKADFTPHERSMTARKLAWTFVTEEQVMGQVLAGELKLPPSFPPPPAAWQEILAAYESSHAELRSRLLETPASDLDKPIRFFTGPGQMGDVPRMQILWLMELDSIHHRGQLSVYIRLAGGKVPSIYGPSADEPWM